jgi:hypothetical protein
MNRLLLFAELILDYWGGGEKGLSCLPPFPFPPPPLEKKEREREKEKGNRARMCPVPGGRGEEVGGGVVFCLKKIKI